MKKILILIALCAVSARAQLGYIVQGVQLSDAEFTELYNSRRDDFAVDGQRIVSVYNSTNYMMKRGKVVNTPENNLMIMYAIGSGGSFETFALVATIPERGLPDQYEFYGPVKYVGTYDSLPGTSLRRVLSKYAVLNRLSKTQFLNAVQSGAIKVDLSAYAPKHTPEPVRYYGVAPAHAR